MVSLKDKIVCITGASSGIGRACAEAFAAQGCRLILSARRYERLEELKENLNTESLIIELDVRDQKKVESTIRSLDDAWSDIDILINNAGLARGLSKMHEGLLSDWEEMIDTNVKGLLYVSREIIPGMVKRNRGHIVNIGSIAGHEVYPNGNVYCASKHAVDALTKGIRMDLIDTPIRVSTVDPGLVETEFSIVRFHGDGNRADKVYKGLDPLTGTDIADAVLYCVSRPEHVQIAEMIIFPTAQKSSTVVSRK
jgi:3-hydroxy acid dehydrogenase / malonic semialdehyde reductase